MNFSFEDLARPGAYKGQPVRMIQKKEDGIRVLLRKHVDGNVDCVTRDGKTDFWPRLSKIKCISVAVACLPTEVALDCEMHVPGEQATSVITFVNDASERVRLTCFAVPVVSSQNSQFSRWSELENLLRNFRWPWVVETRFIEFSRLTAQHVEELKMEALAGRFEGWVVKEDHYRGWYKIKPVRSADFVVTSVTISTSKTHLGKLKAIQVSIPGEDKPRASVGSGFDQAFRHSVDPRSLVGRVCEVSYDSLAANGGLKFPRFVRWRDDKQPHECTVDQLDE